MLISSIGEFESPTGNLPVTLPDAGDDSLPSKVKEPFVFYGVPTRAGDRGRTGDVQLGNPFGSASKTRAVLRIARFSSVWRAPGCPLVPRRTATETATGIELSHGLVQVLWGTAARSVGSSSAPRIENAPTRA